MPTGKGNGAENGAKRETFRPPWVKDGPDSTPPKPSNLWAKNRQATIRDGDQPTEGKKPPLSKVNSQQAQENGTNKENTFVKPQLKPVPPKEAKIQSKEVKIPIKLNRVKTEDNSDIKKPPFVRQPTKEGAMPQELDREPAKTRTDLVRQDSINKMMPKAPPMPPPAPAMPRPPELKPLSNNQKKLIEHLKSRPKVRPDWSGLLKEVERGKKLNHVQCNDRSKPIIEKSVVKDQDKGQFLFESEKDNKDNSHNQLLEEIQKGVALRKTKTNDRSKPMLEGLRKFRRQMTIEEQIVKSMSMASIPPEEIVMDEADELDDIDKVRDDLQSTKQLLAIEMRNKEAQMRDNRRLQARILQLEAELDKSKKAPTTAAAPTVPTEAEEKLLKSLKSEAADARKIAKDLEEKYHSAADQLDHTKSELEEIRRQKQQLEDKLKETLQGGKRQSIVSRKDSFLGHDPTTEEEDSDSEDDSNGSDNEEKREKRTQRELKLLRNKLRSYKNKVDNARKERIALKNLIKKYQEDMKEEKKKHKLLQKEVDKMAAMMKDEDDEDEEEAEEEESESESESSESETSESEQSESEKSASESEDAPVEKKKLNLTMRQKKHENRLTALKKGNFILKTNAERLQDDLNKQKDDTAALQQDLDSVLSELG